MFTAYVAAAAISTHTHSITVFMDIDINQFLAFGLKAENGTTDVNKSLLFIR